MQVQLLLDSPLADEIHLDHISPERVIQNGIAGRLSSSAKLFYRLIRYCGKEQPDIIHLHTSSYLGFYEKAVLLHLLHLFRQRVVLHIHGGGFRDFYAASSKKKFIRSTLNSADLVLALSDNWKSFFSDIAPKANVLVFPNSIDTELYRFSNPDERSSFPLRVLFLGWVVKEKGVFDLLEIAKQFQGKNIVFDIVGDGVGLSELSQLIAHTNLTNQFLLHGWKTGEEKSDLFRRASVFILPSYIEGLPVSIIEAMAAGLPIIASDAGAIPEIVTPERGIVQKPGDIKAFTVALQKLIQSPQLRQDMGRNASIYAQENFEIRTQAAKLADIYEHLV